MGMNIECSKNIKKLRICIHIKKKKNKFFSEMDIYMKFFFGYGVCVSSTTSFLRHREQVVDYVTIVPYTLKSSLTFDVTVINAVVL